MTTERRILFSIRGCKTDYTTDGVEIFKKHIDECNKLTNDDEDLERDYSQLRLPQLFHKLADKESQIDKF